MKERRRHSSSQSQIFRYKEIILNRLISRSHVWLSWKPDWNSENYRNHWEVGESVLDFLPLRNLINYFIIKYWYRYQNRQVSKIYHIKEEDYVKLFLRTPHRWSCLNKGDSPTFILYVYKILKGKRKPIFRKKVDRLPISWFIKNLIFHTHIIMFYRWWDRKLFWNSTLKTSFPLFHSKKSPFS